MSGTCEELEQALRSLSSRIGQRKRQGLPCEALIAEHRELSAKLSELTATRTAPPEKLVRGELPDMEADGVREAWDDLLARSNAFSPAMSWEWIASWHRQFAATHRSSLLTVRESPSGRLVGLLPLFWVPPSRVSWRLEGCLPCRHTAVFGTRIGVEVDYTYPLVAADTDRPRVMKILLEAIREHGLPFVANHWDGGDQNAREFMTIAHQMGFSVISESRMVAFDSLPSTFDEFVSQMPSSRRRTYVHGYQREGWLQDGEFSLEISQDADTILDRLAILRKFNVAKYGPFSIWRERPYLEFTESCVRLSAPRGWPIVWVLYRHRAPIAASFGWIYNDACFITGMTHDIAQRSLEPGHLMLTRVIAYLIERGVKWLDMHTAEGYKTFYLRERRARHTLTLFPPESSPNAALAASFLLRELRTRARSAALHLTRWRTGVSSMVRRSR